MLFREQSDRPCCAWIPNLGLLLWFMLSFQSGPRGQIERRETKSEDQETKKKHRDPTRTEGKMSNIFFLKFPSLNDRKERPDIHKTRWNTILCVLLFRSSVNGVREVPHSMQGRDSNQKLQFGRMLDYEPGRRLVLLFFGHKKQPRKTTVSSFVTQFELKCRNTVVTDPSMDSYRRRKGSVPIQTMRELRVV